MSSKTPEIQGALDEDPQVGASTPTSDSTQQIQVCPSEQRDNITHLRNGRAQTKLQFH